MDHLFVIQVDGIRRLILARREKQLRQPCSLKTIVSQRKYAYGNNLLHLIVLDNSKEKSTCRENFMWTVLQAFCSASVNARNGHGYTALHLAVIRRDYFMVEKLLSALPTINVNAECTNDLGGTALHLAAARTFAVVKTAETMAIYVPSSPPIELKEEKVKIVKLLLSRGASATALDTIGLTPFSKAVFENGVDVLKVLIRRVPLSDVDMSLVGPLHRYVNKGCLESVRMFVDRTGVVDLKGMGGLTPLHLAVLLTRIDMVDYFVGKGADVNARADCLSTPLHMVAENHGADFRSAEHSRMAKVLIENGAGLNLENDRGETPLSVAAREDLPDLVKLFVDAGAELNHRDLLGRTPLHAAVRENATAAVGALVDCGALLDVKDADGRTPFRLAVRGGLTGVVEILIDCKNVDCNAVVDGAGTTLLHEAVAGGCLAVVEALVERGAVVDAKDSSGVTPLEMAELQNRVEIAEFLKNRVSSGAAATVEEPPAKKRKD